MSRLGILAAVLLVGCAQSAPHAPPVEQLIAQCELDGATSERAAGGQSAKVSADYVKTCMHAKGFTFTPGAASCPIAMDPADATNQLRDDARYAECYQPNSN